VIDEVQSEIDDLRQFWPTLVRMRSGTAVSEMIMINTR
jgi:hypothetical protein